MKNQTEELTRWKRVASSAQSSIARLLRHVTGKGAPSPPRPKSGARRLPTASKSIGGSKSVGALATQRSNDARICSRLALASLPIAQRMRESRELPCRSACIYTRRAAQHSSPSFQRDILRIFTSFRGIPHLSAGSLLRSRSLMSRAESRARHVTRVGVGQKQKKCTIVNSQKRCESGELAAIGERRAFVAKNSGKNFASDVHRSWRVTRAERIASARS